MFFKKNKAIICVLLFLVIFTRFVKINWGNNFFFHPDENNMARAITNLSQDSLDPKFYAYGQFPLYVVYFFIKIIIFWFNPTLEFIPSFIQAVYGLRILSAITSCLSVYYFYLFSQKIFKNKKEQLIFILLIIFNPGLIQIAHFGTTESILVFVFAFNLFFSQLIFSNNKINFKTILFIGLINGIGIASKISSIILLGPILLSFLLIRKNFVKNTFSIIFLTSIFTLLFTPYSLINYEEFLSSMRYETGVASGSIKVFYTNQFLKSIPYWFQIKNIFPYVSGLPVFIFSIFGLFNILKKKNFNLKIFLFLVPTFVYFLYFGQIYTKWTRFMSPIFFISPLLAVYFLSRIKSRIIFLFFLCLSILPGIAYLNLYIQPDIRITASQWIDRNISQNSKILSEAGNVINIPIDIKNNMYTNNFDFYTLDENRDRLNELYNFASESDYILVPSRRVFMNQIGNSFPNSEEYYKNLFSGNLGFSEKKIFQVNNYIFLNPEKAEETWTVFDQPKIRIYEKKL